MADETRSAQDIAKTLPAHSQNCPDCKTGADAVSRMTPLALLVSLPIRAYRVFGSPLIGMHCRFQPTCSEYALEALVKHGALKGVWLTLKRIARCRPGGGSGYDGVPD